MRLKYVILATAVLVATPTHALLAQSSPKSKKTATSKNTDYNQLYKDAVADYNANRNREADQKFLQVLKKYPQHIQSLRYRSLLKNRARALSKIPIMKKRLSKVTLDSIAFEHATLAEVMEYVTAKTKEATKGAIAPGLVIQGGDAVRDRELTLKLGTVPVSTLIDATAKLTNTKVTYGTYALTFTPLPTTAQISAEASKLLEKAEAEERRKAAEQEAARDPFRKR